MKKNNILLYKKELSKLSKEELIDLILSNNTISNNNAEIHDAEIQVPVCVFSQDIHPLEGLVKFLIETKKLTIKETALRLNRNFKTIWTTYNNAKNKKMVLEYSEYSIPISVFSKNKFSILESLTGYLLHKGLSISEIARILNKNVRTIWTCHSRYKSKKRIIFSGGKNE